MIQSLISIGALSLLEKYSSEFGELENYNLSQITEWINKNPEILVRRLACRFDDRSKKDDIRQVLVIYDSKDPQIEPYDEGEENNKFWRYLYLDIYKMTKTPNILPPVPTIAANSLTEGATCNNLSWVIQTAKKQLESMPEFQRDLWKSFLNTYERISDEIPRILKFRNIEVNKTQRLLITYRPNNNWLGNDERAQKTIQKWYSNRLSQVPAFKGLISEFEGNCLGCDMHKRVFSGTNLFYFFNIKKPIFLPGFDPKKVAESFPLCSQCNINLEEAISVIDNEMRFTLQFQSPPKTKKPNPWQMVVLPNLLSVDWNIRNAYQNQLLNDLRKLREEDLRKSRAKKLETWLVESHNFEKFLRRVIDNPVYFPSIHILIYKKPQASSNELVAYIQDIVPSRVSEILSKVKLLNNRMVKYSNIQPIFFQLKGEARKFFIMDCHRLMPAQYAKILYPALFLKKRLAHVGIISQCYRWLYKNYVSPVRSKISKEYTEISLKQNTFWQSRLINFLFEVEVISAMKIEINNIPETLEQFLLDNPGLFPDEGGYEALEAFLIGVIAEKAARVQGSKRDGSPINKKIFRKSLSLEEIERLHNHIAWVMQQYSGISMETRQMMSVISQARGRQVERNTLSADTRNFYLIQGWASSRLLLPVSAKEDVVDERENQDN